MLNKNFYLIFIISAVFGISFWIGFNVNLLPAEASINAPIYDELFKILFIIGLIIFIGITIAVIYSLFRFRKRRDQFGDGIALEGMRLIFKWLPEAYKNGSNLEARMNMLTAASMGSTAFQKGLGAIHSLSHPVNALNNLHHGLSNAIFMPYVLTFNRDVIESKVAKISEYLELKDKSFDGFLKWILDLRKKFEIPHKLSSVISEKDLQIDRLSKMALEDPSTNGNPKKLSIEDMKIMYQHSLSGNLF